MSVDPKRLLTSLGYSVDGRGNVKQSTNQIAIVTIENTVEGGVLRIHGDPGQFFYQGDSLTDTLDLSYPVKVTARYVYFQGRTGELRIDREEFISNTVHAFEEYNKLIKKQMAG